MLFTRQHLGARQASRTHDVRAAAPLIQRVRAPPRQYRLIARGATFEGPIPEGVKLEVKPADEGAEVEWNAETKTLRLPINVVEASGERRTKLVVFTCNKCGGRTARNVNPIAWEKGLVLGQCATCGSWHVLSAKNKNIYEEIRYNEPAQGDGNGNGKGAERVMPVVVEESAATPVEMGMREDSGSESETDSSQTGPPPQLPP